MAGREFSSRDKKVHKMTRDGLVEQNLATGEESHISQRGQEFNLRQEQPSTAPSPGHSPEQRNQRRQNRVEHSYQQTADTTTYQPEVGHPTAFPMPESQEPDNSDFPSQDTEPPVSASDASPRAAGPERPSRMRFAGDTAASAPKGKPRQHGTKYHQKFVQDAANPESAPAAPDVPRHEKSSKLQFGKDESPPDSGAPSPDKKLDGAQRRADKSNAKLDNARENIPSKRRARMERVYDEQKDKAKRRLRFEQEHLPPGERKPPLPARAGKAAGGALVNAAAGKIHQKVYEVERENVGTQAAHRAELAAEGLYRGGKKVTHSAFRYARNRPYLTVAKLEQQAVKANINLSHRKALAENPQLRSNVLSRYMQKRKIKQQYAKAARKAKRTKQAAQKTGSAVSGIARAAVGFVRRHPMVIGGAVIILLLFFFMGSFFTSCSNMAAGGFGTVIMSSYTAEDADIIAVDENYIQLEAQLRERIDNIESDYPGYDEYRYSLAEIGHDPYELASYLTSIYYDYTPDEVQAELQALFAQQYTLTITEVVEVRYRTESRTDSEGNSYTVRVAYNYYILNVTLENRSIGSIAAENLDAGQYELYGIYMETRGNKPDLFSGGTYADGYGGGAYTDYDIPGEALSDPEFAALIAEAEKYLGYPYVWGGSSPSTSFDCSGFVCWVLNQSGTASVGRTTANGLLDKCAIIPASEAKPGDLIFFQGTYDTAGASHVGIYVGNNMMIHCGNPISYASIDTSYWRSHFLAFGRIN